MNEPSQNKPKPVAELRDRDIRIPIWKNLSKDGKTYRFTASIPERSYEVNGQWKTATSFNQDEYLRIQRLAGQVVDQIAELYARQR